MNPAVMSELSSIQPYLFFNGRCEEAIDYYRAVLGAEVEMMMRFKECPDPPPEGMLPPGYEEKIMHASFRIRGSVVMASDGCGEETAFGGFALSLSLPDEASCDEVFDQLAKGGTIDMPLDKTFWSPRFGMLTDRFGVSWMIGVTP